MTRLVRGLVWGLVMAAISAAAILAVVPLFNVYVGIAIAIAIVISMIAGLTLNARATRVTCECGHNFLAASGASRCPDCGRRFSEIQAVRTQQGGNR